MPGLNVWPEPVPVVDVRAPEQASWRFSTPPPMWACAALERWQPGIASPVAVSQ